jgi:hypothetical protein
MRRAAHFRTFAGHLAAETTSLLNARARHGWRILDFLHLLRYLLH